MKVVYWFKENYIFISILLVAIVLRLYHIDYQSVWVDELHTLIEANPSISFSEMLKTLVIAEPQPPLYFILNKTLFTIFSYDTLTTRLFSAITGVFGILAIYFLGKEIMNRKVGIIAALLLSVNYFHIYYSQEARMYSMFFLTTTLSFLFLTKFIKNPSLKVAFIHAIFAALMIYSHFFGLFALFAQYIILLFFTIKPFDITRKKMFLFSLLSGLTTLIIFIPTLNFFVEASKRTTIWIPVPSVDIYTQIFKEFFGQSEILIFILTTIFLFLLLKIYDKNKTKNSTINPQNNKLIFAFLFLFIWIFTTLLIPLISSFIKLPMIVSRYFICVLPAIIILIATGFYYIKNHIIKSTLLLIFIIFSFTDIFVVKDYYNKINKSQFREATNLIISNNPKKDPIVSSLAWYMPFFLKTDKFHFEIVDKTFDDYIIEMQKDTTKIKPFWHIDGFGRDYKPNENNLAFINKHFYIDLNYDGFQAWTKHFMLLKDVSKTIDISKFKSLNQNNGDAFLFSIEFFEFANNIISSSGWAYFDKQSSEKSIIDLVLIKDGIALRLLTQKVTRQDVTSYFKLNFDASNSGFSSNFDTTKLKKGKYQLGIYLINKNTNKEGLKITDKFIEI